MRRMSVAPAGTVDVVVIGAGHSGLAMSYCLSRRAIEHVVLERGEVANAWRTERWDSLRLLTPNWMNRLPGKVYRGDDPDGYAGVDEVVGFIAAYAAANGMPVRTHTRVLRVSSCGNGYRVVTDRGAWRCRAVVIASGACNVASVPSLSAQLPATVQQVTARDYRRPGDLPEGGVLVVGASATGVQLADEIRLSGRPVTLAVGEHVRMPRLYRGRDIQWWMLASGLLDEGPAEVDDAERVRRLPSPQLIGTAERATLDLNTLRARGVELVGRLAGVRDGQAQFSGSLRNVCALADLKMQRLLASFDRWADANGIAAESPAPVVPTAVAASPLLLLDFRRRAVRTVVWATGYRPDYSWLDLPVLDRKGRLQHTGGVLDMPGLYALGLPFLRRRKSTFLHGAEDDARDLACHLACYLDHTARRVSGMAN